MGGNNAGPVCHSRVAARRFRRCSSTAKPPATPGVTLVLGLEALEHMNAPEARALLRRLAEGEPEAWLTKAALQRFAR
jgi:hypothetical protein